MRAAPAVRECHNTTGVFEYLLRVELPDIAAYMPDVKKIEVLSRRETDDGVKLHNRWYASTELPKMLQSVVKPEWMQWDDYAEWSDSEGWRPVAVYVRRPRENLRVSDLDHLAVECLQIAVLVEYFFRHRPIPSPTATIFTQAPGRSK